MKAKNGFWQEGDGVKGLYSRGWQPDAPAGPASPVLTDSLAPRVRPHGCFWKRHLYMCNIATGDAAVTGLAPAREMLNKATEVRAGSV